jgi:hypothetical protein
VGCSTCLCSWRGLGRSSSHSYLQNLGHELIGSLRGYVTAAVQGALCKERYETEQKLQAAVGREGPAVGFVNKVGSTCIVFATSPKLDTNR